MMALERELEDAKSLELGQWGYLYQVPQDTLSIYAECCRPSQRNDPIRRSRKTHDSMSMEATMNLNTVALVGRVARPPAVLYRKDGVPLLRFVVVSEDENAKLGRTFKTAIPCELVGDRPETFGAELDAGDIVMVAGRLAYRATGDQAGGSLGVYCRQVQCLSQDRSRQVADYDDVPV